MANRGRKRVELNWKEFENLCTIQAPLGEIASFFHCSEDAMERAVNREYGRNFAEVFSEKRQQGLILLRRQLWKSALRGNAAVRSFLAKKWPGGGGST